jgi:hypothetical protein
MMIALYQAKQTKGDKTMGEDFAMVVLLLMGIMGIVIVANVVFWTWFDNN